MATLNGGVTESALTGVVSSYLEFLHQAGQTSDRAFENKIPKLFSEFCKKTVNGETRVHSREELGPYFGKAQEMYGKWKMENSPSLSSFSFL